MIQRNSYKPNTEGLEERFLLDVGLSAITAPPRTDTTQMAIISPSATPIMPASQAPEAAASAEDIQADIAALQTQIDAKQEEIRAADIQINKLFDELNASTQDRDALNTQVVDSQQQTATMLQSLNELQASDVDLQHSIDDSSKSLLEIQQSIDQTTTTIADLNGQKQTLEGRQSALNADLVGLGDQRQAALAESDAAGVRIAELDSEIATSNSQLAQWQVQQQGLVDEAAGVNALRAEIAGRQANLQIERQDQEAALAALDQQIQSTQDQRSTVEAQAAAASATLAAFEQEAAALEQEAASAAQEQQQLTANADQLKTQFVAELHQWQAAKAELMTFLRQPIPNEHRNSLIAYASQRAALSAKCDTALDQLMGTWDTLYGVQTNLAAVNDHITDLHARLEHNAGERQSTQAAIIDFESEIAAADRQIASLRTQQQETTAQIAGIANELADLQTDETNLARRASELADQRAQLESDIQAAQARLQELTQRQADERQRHEELTKQLAAIDANISETTQELNRTTAALAELAQQIAGKASDLEALYSRQSGLQNRHDELLVKKTDLLTAIATSEATYQEAVRAQHDLTARLADVNEQCQSLTQQLTSQLEAGRWLALELVMLEDKLEQLLIAAAGLDLAALNSDLAILEQQSLLPGTNLDGRIAADTARIIQLNGLSDRLVPIFAALQQIEPQTRHTEFTQLQGAVQAAAGRLATQIQAARRETDDIGDIVQSNLPHYVADQLSFTAAATTDSTGKAQMILPLDKVQGTVTIESWQGPQATAAALTPTSAGTVERINAALPALAAPDRSLAEQLGMPEGRQNGGSFNLKKMLIDVGGISIITDDGIRDYRYAQVAPINETVVRNGIISTAHVVTGYGNVVNYYSVGMSTVEVKFDSPHYVRSITPEHLGGPAVGILSVHKANGDGIDISIGPSGPILIDDVIASFAVRPAYAGAAYGLRAINTSPLPDLTVAETSTSAVAMAAQGSLVDIDLRGAARRITQVSMTVISDRTGDHVTARAYRGEEQVEERAIAADGTVGFISEDGITSVVLTKSDPSSTLLISQVRITGRDGAAQPAAEPLSPKTNRTVGINAAPVWQSRDAIDYTALKRQGVYFHYADHTQDIDGSLQYALSGDNATSEYARHEVRSLGGSAAIDSLSYFNETGVHPLSPVYYTISSTGIAITYPGSPKHIILNLRGNGPIDVSHNRQIGATFASVAPPKGIVMRPDILVLLAQPTDKPGWRDGLTEVTSRNAVMLDGGTVQVVAQLSNDGSEGGLITVRTYCGYTGTTNDAFQGEFTATFGPMQVRSLVFNATSPNRPEGNNHNVVISFVSTLPDGTVVPYSRTAMGPRSSETRVYDPETHELRYVYEQPSLDDLIRISRIRARDVKAAIERGDTSRDYAGAAAEAQKAVETERARLAEEAKKASDAGAAPVPPIPPDLQAMNEALLGLQAGLGAQERLLALIQEAADPSVTSESGGGRDLSDPNLLKLFQFVNSDIYQGVRDTFAGKSNRTLLAEALHWYDGQDLKTMQDRTLVRHDTPVGTLYLGLYQRLWKATEAREWAILAITIDSLTDIPAYKIYNVRNTAQNDESLFRSKLHKLFLDAGYTDTFSSLQQPQSPRMLRAAVDKDLYVDGSVRIRVDLVPGGHQLSHFRVYLPDGSAVIASGRDAFFINVPVARIVGAGGLCMANVQLPMVAYFTDGTKLEGRTDPFDVSAEGTNRLSFDASQFVAAAEWSKLNADSQAMLQRALNFGSELPDKNRRLIQWTVDNYLANGALTFAAKGKFGMEWDGIAYDNTYIDSKDGTEKTNDKGQCKFWVDNDVVQLALPGTDLPGNHNDPLLDESGQPLINPKTKKPLVANSYSWAPKDDTVTPLVQKLEAGHFEEAFLDPEDEAHRIQTGDIIQMAGGSLGQHTIIVGAIEADRIWMFDANAVKALTPAYHPWSLARLNETVTGFTVYRLAP